MLQTKTMMVAAVAAFLVLAPGAAVAANNDIDQGSFDADAEGDDIFANNANFNLGFFPYYGVAGVNGFGDAAVAAANCQLITVADSWVLVLAANGALGLISDEDDVSVTNERNGPGLLPFNLDEELAEAWCTAPVGPITIHVETTPGWGELAPQGGSIASLASGLGYGGGGGGGKSNSIDQGSFNADADADEVISNDADLILSAVNGAAAAANCQAIVGAHLGAAVVAANVAAGQIEDGDTVVVTGGEPDAMATPTDARQIEKFVLEVENDHHAKAWCEQPIESIDIWVGPKDHRVSPES